VDVECRRLPDVVAVVLVQPVGGDAAEPGRFFVGQQRVVRQAGVLGEVVGGVDSEAVEPAL
jgi:hypothetical protein